MSEINFNQLGLYFFEGVDVVIDGSENYREGDVTHIDYINKTSGSSVTLFKGEKLVEFKKLLSSLGPAYNQQELQGSQVIIISKDVYAKLTRKQAETSLLRMVALVKLGYLVELEKDELSSLGIVDDIAADKYVVGIVGRQTVYDTIKRVVEVTAEIISPFYGQTKEQIVEHVYATNYANINVRLKALE